MNADRSDDDASDTAVRWLMRLGRAGWLSKGFVFVVIGVIAIRIATRQWGGDDAQATQAGALRVLASQPFGAVLLVLVSVGLVVFMLWNIAQALVPRSTDIDPLGIAKRIGWFGLGLFYGTVALLGLRLAMSEIDSPSGGSSSSTNQTGNGGGQSPQALTARLLDAPGGRVVAIVIAAVVLIVAGYHLKKGVTYDFVDDIDTRDLDEDTEEWIGRLGVSGFVARAFVLATVAYFLAKAAIQFDPEEAVGLDGALRELASVMYGRLLIGLVGAGLIVAGLYDMLTFRRQTLR